MDRQLICLVTFVLALSTRGKFENVLMCNNSLKVCTVNIKDMRGSLALFSTAL